MSNNNGSDNTIENLISVTWILLIFFGVFYLLYKITKKIFIAIKKHIELKKYCESKNITIKEFKEIKKKKELEAKYGNILN